MSTRDETDIGTLSMVANPDDIAIVKSMMFGDKEYRLKKPARVRVRDLDNCKTVIERIEQAGA